MALLNRFAAPAFLPDFSGIPGQAEAWHRAVSSWFDSSIASESRNYPNTTMQFYNPARRDPGGTIVEQPITWNAFPKELLRRYGRAEAMRRADRVAPISGYSEGSGFQGPVLDQTFFRPQTEYSEWHVTRDPDTGKIVRVAFSSEPPEYWQALFGDTISIQIGEEMVDIAFPGDRSRVLALYRQFVGPDVRLEDLICREDIQSADGTNVLARKGQYNPWNKWNSTHGIMHLAAPPNSLSAEIQLGADATILRRNSRGHVVSEPSALICCGLFGGPDRNSDPTIGAAVNDLARLGAMITLPNPVGLYMDHIDLAGWTAPDGKPIAECVRMARGIGGMVERLLVEVPPERGFVVGDMRIGGEPIDYGGQIAECITVKLIGAAAAIGSVKNKPLACEGKCCVDASEPRSLSRAIEIGSPCPPGTRVAFEVEGSVTPEGVERLPVRERFRYPSRSRR